MELGGKAIWAFMAFLLVVTSVYMGLALATFHNVKQSFAVVYVGGTQLSTVERDAFRNGMLAATMIGFLLVLFFLIFATLVLIWRRFGNAPLAYGILIGTALQTSWFMVLAGLVLQNRDETMKYNVDNGWAFSQEDLNTYRATWAFSYMLAGVYFIVFMLLLLTRKRLGAATEAAGSSTAAVAKPGASGVGPFDGGTTFGASFGRTPSAARSHAI